MEEPRYYFQKRAFVRLQWLKRAAIVLMLGSVLTACAPSRPQGSMEPTSTGQPAMMPATLTQVPTPSREEPQPTATQQAQIPTPAVGSVPYAEPKELPTKGSSQAKVTLVVYCDFH